MNNRHFARIACTSLLGGASFLSLVTAAQAQQVVFSSTPQIPVGTIEAGREFALSGSTVQVKLPSGGMASFVGTAQFSIRPDGGIDLRSGSVTIVAGRGGEATIHLPEGVRGTVASGGTGSFTASASGARGSIATGMVSVTANGVTRPFGIGQFWTASGSSAPDRVIAGTAAAVPGTDTGPVVPLREGGIVAAAENGIPIALGEALAGVGARGDIVAAARRLEAFEGNPTIAAFPTGDYALLVQYAAQANGLLGAGGTTFNGAGADIIRTYFEYLASGNSGPAFRTAYAGILLNYLDLVRSGVLPSSFRGATQSQLNAYLAFIGRTDGFGGLSTSNRQLLDAYLAFLQTGGQPDAFGTSVTGLTTAFLNFVRGGGNPASFSQASATVVAQYLAIVNSGGLRTNLNAQNQALLAAYLANNGVGFTASYATGLAAFVAFLNTGGLPSGYSALPPATIRAYLETLETTGLFDSVLGSQSAFLRSYLSFLRSGGTPDQFNALPINVARVNASALSVYVDYLLSGGLPSNYTTLTAAQIRAALDQLTATGQFNTLLGANAAFLGEYYAYLRTGADADTFAGLPSVDVNAYASALSVFATYLRAGNLPSGYTPLTAQQIRNYLTALQVGGKLTLLGSDATLLGDYLLYLRTGGAPDQFAGLPIVTYQSYASALSLYFAYLNGGGLPTGYAALTQAQLRAYLDVLKANGQFALLGANAAFYTDYLAFLAGGGSADAYTALPIVTFQGYATALAAYYAFLLSGGAPTAYTALTQAQVREYLDALKTSGQLTALLGANASFFDNYLAFLATGGNANAFPGLPSSTYGQYAAALSAYFAYLGGGGLPSGYTALTAAQIREYLDVLKANNQLTALLGANASFFDAYLTFLTGGGSPDAFTGLPAVTYASYGSAIQAFVAFLRDNGLPGSYAALSATQLREFLAVLTANGQLARIGSQADIALVNAYAAYLATGGVPNQFAGLPAFVTYEASLRTYYAFLLGGGRPSTYTALTQAQIVAYIQALDAAGLVASRLTTEEAAFLRSYAIFVGGGGNADQFAGLPGNQGPTVPVVVQGLAGAPRSSTGTLASGAIGRAFISAVNTAGSVTISGNSLTAYQGAASATAQTTTTVEARTIDSSVAIARWGAGTYRSETATQTIGANEGLHFVWGTPATAVPTTGGATFGFVAATSPTVDGGAVAPGSFTGNLGLDFATRRVGLDSRITMNGIVYGFATAGGTAAPSLALGVANTFNGVGTTTNLANSTGLVNGFLAGTGGAYAGLIYSAILPIGAVSGTAVFGLGQAAATLPTVTPPVVVPPTLPAPNYPYVAGLPTGRVNIRTVAQNVNFRETNIVPGVAVTLAANGGLERIGTGTQVQDFQRGTAKVADIAGDARAVVGRWYDGSFAQGTTTKTLALNQSLHYLLLAPPTFTIPTGGRVDYTVLAATQPTFQSGVTAPGLFDARMAVLFGTAPRVAIEGTVRMPEPGGTVTYAFATAGGIAGAAALPTTIFSGYNFSVDAPVAGAGLACVSGCTLRLDGAFAGSDASRAGGYYYLTDSRNGPDSIIGSVAFTGVVTAPPVTSGLTQTPFAYVAGLPTTGVGLRTIYPSTTAASLTAFNGTAITQASDGGLDRTGPATPGSQDIARGTARNADVAGDARVVVGRWLDGGYTRGTTANALAANQSLHYAALAPVTFAIPYLGRVDYTLLAATQPTFAGGQTGQGLFDARMAILFASAPKVALEGMIRMPETGGTVTYAFATPGGIANPAQAVAVGDLSGGAFNVTAPLTGTGLACATGASCTLRFEGGLAGADPLRAGGVYFTAQGGTASGTSITGAAAFTGAWVGDAQSVTTVSNRQFFAIAPSSANALSVNQGSYDVDATGRVVGLTNFNGLYDRLGSAQIAQSGATTSGNIGWTRWSNGTLDIRRNGTANSQLTANQGYQILHGAAATALPTSGTVNYTLSGGTSPTDHAGTLAPGTLGTGAAAVSFGTTSRVAFDFTTTIGGSSYNLFTTGKIAGIAQSEITLASGAFNNIIGPGGNVTGGSCAATQCRPIWHGFLAGAGGTELGLNYQVQNTATQFRFGGVAAFTATGAPVGGGGTATGTVSGQTTYAYAGGSLVDQGITTATYANNVISGYASFLTGTAKAATVIQERGRLAETIGWARWTGDTAGPLNNQLATAGVHVMSGTPTAVATLPTTGTVAYTMVGGTNPTLTQGGPSGAVLASPGTITGSLAIAYGSGLPRVGMDLTATVGSYGWRVQTPGGSANPTQSQMTVGSFGTFSQTFTKQIGVTPTTGTSCVNTCSGTIGGQLYGTGGSHIGLAFNMLDGSATSSGIAVFARP